MRTITSILAGTLGSLSLCVAAQAAALSPQAVAEANNNFGWELFQKIHRTNITSNTLVSPLSSFLALSMTYNGAQAATQDAMANALHVNNLTMNELNGGSMNLLGHTQALSAGYQLSVANSLWVRQGLQLNANFEANVKRYYGATVSALDFNDAASPVTINAWVNKQTFGKIPSVVDGPISPDSALYLINATYFKADWTVPFAHEATRPELFSVSNKSQRTVDMMTRTGEFKHLVNRDFDAVELTYGPDASASFILVLPRKGLALSQMVGDLSEAKLGQALSELSARATEPGSVALPKFKFEEKTLLNKPLSEMGMSRAFSDSADFSAMSPQSLSISSMIQKTFVAVDEKGTEAAAATSTDFSATSVDPAGFFVRANRPFMFIIRENATGSFLFVGTVSSPK